MTDDAGLDGDGDSVPNGHEYVSDTDPLDAAEYCRIASLGVSNSVSVVRITWPSSSNRLYTLRHSGTPGAGGWSNVADCTDLPGNGSVMVWTNRTPIVPRRFYRLSVELPLRLYLSP